MSESIHKVFQQFLHAGRIASHKPLHDVLAPECKRNQGFRIHVRRARVYIELLLCTSFLILLYMHVHWIFSLSTLARDAHHYLCPHHAALCTLFCEYFGAIDCNMFCNFEYFNFLSSEYFNFKFRNLLFVQSLNHCAGWLFNI